MKKCSLVVLILAVLLPGLALAQEPYNQWVVTPGDPGTGGTVHVTISALIDMSSGCSSMCASYGPPVAVLALTPCPLGRTCSGGTYYSEYPAYSWPMTDTLSLQCGVQYTFTGSWYWNIVMMGPIPNPPYYDCNMYSQCGGPFTPTGFLYGVTPARPTTWGRIKTLYR